MSASLAVALVAEPPAEPPRTDRCAGRYRHWFVARGGRWRCERCGADLDAATFGWYLRGVLDGRGQSARHADAADTA